MFRVLVSLGIIALLIVVLVVVIGLLLPKKHRASRARTFASPPQRVWDTITDFANSPGWRKSLKSVEALPARNGHMMWKETDQSGDAITYETLEIQAPTKIVRKIADEGLPFGGTWTIQVKPLSGQSTQVEVVEDGIVSNPIFRFVSKFITGHTRAIDEYLHDLGDDLESASRAPGAAAPGATH